MILLINIIGYLLSQYFRFADNLEIRVLFAGICTFGPKSCLASSRKNDIISVKTNGKFRLNFSAVLGINEDRYVCQSI